MKYVVKIGITQEIKFVFDQMGEALGNEYGEPRPADIRAIHDIMRNSISGWLPVGKQKCGNYGVQRSYDKAAKFEEITLEDEKRLPFD